MQTEWDFVEYPHGKSRPVREPSDKIKDYKMDEIADLLWIGGLMALHATPKFREAFGHLQAAAQHYLFGFDATAEDIGKASNHLHDYAELLEKEVMAGKVLS